MLTGVRCILVAALSFLSQKLLQSTLNLAIHSIFLAAKQIEESILFRKDNYENQG